MTQSARVELLSLALSNIRVGTPDAIQRILSHLVNLNDNQDGSRTDTLTELEYQTIEALTDVLGNTLLAGFSSSSVDDIKNALVRHLQLQHSILSYIYDV